jgi:hypothetical protein
MVAMKAERTFTLLLVILVARGLLCQAQQRPCSSTNAAQADREAGRVRSWDALNHSYRRFVPRCPHCKVLLGFPYWYRLLLGVHTCVLLGMSCMQG